MLIQHFSIKSKEHTVNHIFQYAVNLIDRQVELDYRLSALLVKRSSTNGQMANKCVLLDWISYSSLSRTDNPAENLPELYTIEQYITKFKML
jgi:hypothetical protein